MRARVERGLRLHRTNLALFLKFPATDALLFRISGECLWISTHPIDYRALEPRCLRYRGVRHSLQNDERRWQRGWARLQAGKPVQGRTGRNFDWLAPPRTEGNRRRQERAFPIVQFAGEAHTSGNAWHRPDSRE